MSLPSSTRGPARRTLSRKPPLVEWCFPALLSIYSRLRRFLFRDPFSIKDNAIPATAFKQIKAPKKPGERAENETERGLRVYDKGFLNTAVMHSKITYIDGDAGGAFPLANYIFSRTAPGFSFALRFSFVSLPLVPHPYLKSSATVDTRLRSSRNIPILSKSPTSSSMAIYRQRISSNSSSTRLCIIASPMLMPRPCSVRSVIMHTRCPS